MKRILIILIGACLLACTSKLDQKIKVGEYKTVMDEIKAENTEYTEADFDGAGDIIAGKTMAAMMTGETAQFDMTYGEVLEKAQKKNQKRQKEIEAYNAKVQKLRDVFTIKLTSGNYSDISETNMYYPDAYEYDMVAVNKSNRTITGFKGELVLKNNKGEVLLDIPMEAGLTFPPKGEREGSHYAIIFESANVMELKAIPFNNLTQEWHPAILIFKYGEIMEAPSNPL